MKFPSKLLKKFRDHKREKEQLEGRIQMMDRLLKRETQRAENLRRKLDRIARAEVYRDHPTQMIELCVAVDEHMARYANVPVFELAAERLIEDLRRHIKTR